MPPHENLLSAVRTGFILNQTTFKAWCRENGIDPGYLRFWNDRDRTATPFPVGLAFIGNPEFSLDRKHGVESVISGAVRSRAMFIESLDYLHLSEADLQLFVRSRGVTDSGAIARISASSFWSKSWQRLHFGLPTRR